jgi:hypothetical protein
VNAGTVPTVGSRINEASAAVMTRGVSIGIPIVKGSGSGNGVGTGKGKGKRTRIGTREGTGKGIMVGGKIRTGTGIARGSATMNTAHHNQTAPRLKRWHRARSGMSAKTLGLPPSATTSSP